MRLGASGVLALALVAALPTATNAAMRPWAEGDPVLWRWMPHGEELFDPWRRGLAANGPLGKREMFALPGDASIVYDPKRRVVLYYESCCAYQETVLASVSGPPPKHVRFASLGAMRTVRGIELGASPQAVRLAYGPAPLHRSTTGSGARVLSYYRDQHVSGSSCGWFENFVFRAGRLTEIQAGHGC
jgi:hypothetical protein